MKIRFFAFAAFLLFSCQQESTETAAASASNTQARPASYQAAPAVLQTWVDARAGTGAPVHWIAEGAVYEYPSGKKLFGMIGFDSSTIIWPEEEGGDIIHLTRKTFAYTDPETGAVLKEFNGNLVKAIAYPYQMITYRFEDDRIFGDVEQGVGERKQVIEAKDGIPYRKLGDSYIYNAAVFLDLELPGGNRYEAWENYDFFIHPKGSVEEPHQMSWQRYGNLPSWAGPGKCITHLHSWRVESHDEFPAHILAWAKAEQPKWLNPPVDLAEVRAIQNGESGFAWGD